VLVGLGGFDIEEVEDVEEDSDFLEVAESEACSLMELSCGLSPESFGGAEARIRWVEVNVRIEVYRRLGGALEGHSLAGGSLKEFIIFTELQVSNGSM
jgi:hypothetical protein